MKTRIAFVVQRYGEEVNGGAEAECRMYAERLAPAFDVDVITSCAVDHLTWRNEYPAGESVLNGVTVRRFPVEEERDLEAFSRLCAAIAAPGGHSRAEEERWLRAQGPYAPAAVEYIREHSAEYAAVFFMTYLYYFTVAGMEVCAAPALLIPTAHDEWPIYLRCYRDVFERADGFVYNSEAERRFVDSLFLETSGKPFITVGAGVEYPAGELPDVGERFGLTTPYILYCGRIEEAKGCGELMEYFRRYKERYGGEVKLVMTGRAAMPIPEREDILPLGFVSEEEKYALMAGASAFALASHFESLSIVVLESLMMGTPVLVNGECEVLKDHVLLSRAGLYFHGAAEFGAALQWLLDHPAERERMGQNGRSYVRERYNWSAITEKMGALAAALQRDGQNA